MNTAEEYDKIYRYCYFRLRDKSLAEDLTQETFLKFLSQSTYRDEGKELRYLYTIARNLCADAYRKAGEWAVSFDEIELRADGGLAGTGGAATGRIVSNGADSGKGDATVSTASPVEETVVKNTMLKKAIETLSEDERELIFLRFVNEVPLAELSAFYGISRFALHRKISRIRAKLKKELEE